MKNCILKAFFVSILFLQNSCYGMSFERAVAIEKSFLNAFYTQFKGYFVESCRFLARAETRVQSSLDGTPEVRRRSDIEAEVLRQFLKYLQRSEARSEVQLIHAFVDGQSKVHFGINTLESDKNQSFAPVALRLLDYIVDGGKRIMPIGLPQELALYSSFADRPLVWSCPMIYLIWTILNEFFVFLFIAGGYYSLVDFAQGLFKEHFDDELFVEGLEAGLDNVWRVCENFSIQSFPFSDGLLGRGQKLHGVLCAFRDVLRMTRQPIASAGPTIVFPGRAPVA